MDLVDPHHVRAPTLCAKSCARSDCLRLLRSWAGLEFILLLVVVPETYLPAVLKKKAVQLRKEGRTDVRAPIEVDTRSISRVILTSCSRPFRASCLRLRTQVNAVGRGLPAQD